MQTRQSPIYLKKVQAASFYTSPAVERLLAEVEVKILRLDMQGLTSY